MKEFLFSRFTRAVIIFVFASLCQTSCAAYQPVIDLSYALYAGSPIKSPAGLAYYNFSNIRYAAPPVGELRFARPQDPINNLSAGVQDGSCGKICPQAYTPWQNLSLVTAPPGENECEDCLFLDIIVPSTIWKIRHKSSVPVIVWVHGGGYQLGSKFGNPPSNPLGLLDRSFDGGAEGAIWVSMNYRLGASGFLQRTSFTTAGGLPNAGLHDQRKALEWAQTHISGFGGNADRVTVMGESARGCSILHHITVYGGSQAAPPFQQAILQSPAYVPRLYSSQAEKSYAAFLEYAGASSVEELRHGQQGLSDVYFQRNYVPALPEALLMRGQYHQNVKVMTAHNTFEGKRYTDPAATTSDSFDAYMLDYFPGADTIFLSTLLTKIYPAIYDGSYAYTSAYDRLMLAISEFTFTCHASQAATYLGSKIGQDAYSYLFSVPLGIHTLDVYYTYFVNSTSSVTNRTVAEYMQGYITSFVQDGDPNKINLPVFPVYGTGFVDLNINQTFISTITDPAATSRCHWWEISLGAQQNLLSTKTKVIFPHRDHQLLHGTMRGLLR